jgi:transposase-like protein
MKVSSFLNFKKKYQTGIFRWQVIELYRLGLVSESQILAELKISRSLLRVWNRSYHRYRLNRFYPPFKRSSVMKNPNDEIALLKEQLAQTEKLLQQEKLKREALDTMITIAEQDGAARAV